MKERIKIENNKTLKNYDKNGNERTKTIHIETRKTFLKIPLDILRPWNTCSILNRVEFRGGEALDFPLVRPYPIPLLRP